MKLSTRGEERATTSGGAFLGTYRIVQSKAAFETLSSRLYSDKIRAVIRELSCNAWDAHQDAGRGDVPFEVHLPTDFEPYFEIKDFGTGMTHRDIVDLFASYFGTNKSDSNKFIGALGLGSKSPFCLTIRNAKNGREEPQGFTIVDRYKGDSGICPVCDKLTLLRDDGKISQKTAWDKIYGDDGNALPEERGSHVCEGVGQDTVRIPFTTRIYDALVEEGEPGIRLSGEMETPEEVLGINVKFDVPQNAVWEYENKAKIVFPFFDPLPTINIEGFPLSNPRKTEKFYSILSGQWGMRTESSTPQGSTVRAIQGNVPYSVGNIDISRTTDYQKKLLLMPLDLYFPIGSLDPAVSRETLELNDRTIDSILKMLEEVFVGLMEEVKNKINACASSWKARIMIFELSSSPGLGKLVNDAWNTGKLFGKYDNFSLDVKKPTINDLDYEGIQVTRFAHNWKSGVKRAEKGTVLSVVENYQRQNVMGEIANGSITKASYDRQVEVEPSVQFVVNDLKVGGDKYVHYFIQTASDNQGEGDDAKGKKKKVYVIGRANRHVDIKTVIKQAKKLLKNLGNPGSCLLSTLKARYSPIIDLRNTNPRVPAERRTIVTLKDKIDRYRRGNGWTKAWDRSDEQPEGVKYYVAIDRYRALESGFNSARSLLAFVDHVRAAGCFGLDEGTPLYGLRTRSKLRKHTMEWVELIPHVMNMVQGIMTPAKELSLTTMLQPFECNYDGLLEHLAEAKPLSPFSPIQQFAERLALVNQPRTQADENLHDVLHEAQRRGRYSINNTVDFDPLWAEVIAKYPVLTLDFYRHDSESTRETIIDYIILMDERAGVAPKAKAAAATQEASHE